MERPWGFDDREKMHNLSMDVLDLYVECLSKHLNLSFKDTYHLSHEMGYHAISVFIDTVFRLNNKGLIPAGKVKQNIDFKPILAAFFSDEIVEAPLGSSRILRCKLANSILDAYGVSPFFNENQKEPEQIQLEELDLPLAPEERFWRLHYNITHRIPGYIVNHIKSYFNYLRQIFKRKLVRIGFIYIDEKRMKQLPDIKWVPLGIDIDRYLGECMVDERYTLYKTLKDDFLGKIYGLSDFQVATNRDKEPTQFFELLLSFITIKSESLICNKNLLYQATDYCEEMIEKLKLQALFSQGNWFRFQNTIIAIAGRRLNLPICEYQLGGQVLDKLGSGIDIGDGGNKYSDHVFAWGDWDFNKDSTPVYHRVPNPFLLHQLNAYSTHKNKREKLNVLYSPIAVSSMYSVENWLSISTYDMKEIRSTVDVAFKALDDSEVVSDFNLFIKAKGFSYELFRSNEYLILPIIQLSNINVKYIVSGDVLMYLEYMDIHISCSNSTTFVYSMNYNVPTIIIWNDVFKIKDKYLSLFDDLVKVGIVCKNPQSISENYNLISDKNYWLSEEVQNIRNKFCNYFAYTSHDSNNELNDAILNILD